jgi:two-component system OmpR family sensor kinase
MKRRLFWKILIGFWITFLIMIQGIWLIFAIWRPIPERTRSMAEISVQSVASAIAVGGEAAFEAQRSTWSEDQRRQIRVQPEATAPPSQRAVASRIVKALDGTSYRVSYYLPPPAPGLFNIPKEIAGIAVAGGLAFSAILAWYLTLPIRGMREGFGKLAQGNFATRLGPTMGRRRDEIADLALDFDKMAMRLQELVAARDRLLADVSHELRTPLARLNLAIGLARQDPEKMASSLDRIGGEVSKLDEMVGELLTLAKLESGPDRGDSYFSFSEVVKSVVHDARFEASAKHVDIALTITPDDETLDWVALGDGRLVSRAVENIIRNALRYSPDGGKVSVTLQADSDRFHLLVSDEGPGISDDSLATLFKPFAVSADGFGFGLGLAIAQRAIAVHGGTIAIRNRGARGLDAEVSLPAAALA